MRRKHNQSFLLHIESLEARRLLSDDCGCGGDSGPSDEEPNSPPPVDYCYIGSDGNEYCCLESELDWRGKCPDDPEYDPDGPGDPPPEEPPEPNPNPHPDPNDPEDPDDPFPDDPPLPDPDPCADYELTVDLVYEGMREEEVTEPPHPQHETEPGGYLPLNRGFSEWYAHWHEDGVGGGPVPTAPPFEDLALDFYEDFQHDARLITGSLPGIGVLDPQLREGSVSIGTSGGFSLPGGKRVPFSFSFPFGLDLWILYDHDLEDEEPAKWDQIANGEIFYAGNGRPMSFDMTYEGDDPGLDQTAIARAAVNAYCPESNSWRVLRARDDVLLHVVDTELTADSTNDDGLDKSASTWATIEDEYVEWINQERPGMLAGPMPGKLLSVNDEDPGGATVPDWADGFNADGVTGGTPGDDSSPQAAFTPIEVTLPGWNHGEVRFRFIYEAADPHFSSQADPSARVDPADMRRTGSVEDGNIRYDMGTGKMRLWTKDGNELRNGYSIADGGDFVDSQEWDAAEGMQQPVYYTHEDFGLSSAGGGTITLWVEALRPSLALGDRSVTVQAVFAEEHTDAQGNTQTLLPYTYVDSKLIPMTVVDVDLDIDSDNTNGFNLPDRSDYEDMLEDAPDLPGKFIAVNDDDTDGDNLIDWADFNGIAGEQFVPLKLVLPAGVDLTGATIRFEYDGSDPLGIDPLLPAAGALRLWSRPGADQRNPLPAGEGALAGQYVSPGDELPIEVFYRDGLGEITVWAEGVQSSEALGNERVEVTLTLDAAANRWMNIATIQPDAVRMTAGVAIDADVDSDNNDGFGAPDHTKPEDDVEDVQNDKTKPGKVLVANDDDGDLDGIPDFADGMNLFGDQADDNAPPTAAQGERFAWFTLEIPAILDLSRVRVKFVYNGSDPRLVVRTGAGSSADPYTYTPAPGGLRLWRKQGHQTREANNIQQDSPGDYVAPTPGAGDYYALADLEHLGFSDTTRRIDLWVESMTYTNTIGEQPITVKVDPDGAGGSGFVLEDRVRFSAASLAISSASGPAGKLKVAKWTNSYNAQGNLEDEFIEFDDDRFTVRLIAPYLNKDPQAVEKVAVRIFTDSPDIDYNGNDADHDDAATIIQLTESSPNIGLFRSESQMLVGDAVDDAGPGQFGIPLTAQILPDNLDQPPAAAHGDRTHKVGLGGVVSAEWEDFGQVFRRQIAAPIEKAIRNIKFYILRTPNGFPAATVGAVKEDIGWANERLAQAGVQILIDPDQAIQVVDHPPAPGVDLADGLDGFAAPPNLTDEERALFDAFGTVDTADIVVFYINEFVGGGQGEATAETGFPNEQPKRVNNVVIAAQSPQHTRIDLTHELLHVLTGITGHSAQPYNLLFQPPAGWNPDDANVLKERRIALFQADLIQQSKFVENP